ncbi:ABC transporter permease [Tepidibacter formicigenes]|jgi:peptide/nickel transport system permease protein|uniref:Peptide/nickel transport system permease protein n=1 Tax=Tepidibacter formicigenes DSM 15518 TaxID=1123349 RepID=A0A1M6M2X5_9FIRM|nr:ABC transporter permease [Tepidibacter formicigenes]SHJ77828.1 peptide/nickel transport system permease protein [Tepidibacter formicigenes DSM 15518]
MKKILNFIKGFSIIGKISILIFIVIIFIAIFSPYLLKTSHILPSGNSLEPPSKNHILGTDDIGIDLYSQLCYGVRMSIIIGLGTAFLSILIGSIIGILSGYLGGWIDNFLMRFTDMMITLPDLPTMIVLGAFFGPSIKNIILVLSVFSWTSLARIIRSKILSIKEENYIKVVRGYGGGFFYITINHFLPQIYPIIMVSFIRLVSKAIIAEASLSFLGLGDPTSKSWGLILHYALNFTGIYFTPYWKWWVLSPLIAILIIVISIAFIGREFENKFNYKL